MSAWQTITSDEVVSAFDNHCRVLAGPGAGKTTWLANHIRHVVRHSTRLTPTSRVACISYTNVAVSELMERLQECAGSVEGSTIHSFLFRNVVRPYIHLLKDESGQTIVDHARIQGHDEHRPTRECVAAWLDSTGARSFAISKLINDDRQAVWKYLKRIRWRFRDDWTWSVQCPHGEPPRFLPVTKIDSYKQFYWREGIVDHDDVLYFSFHILNQHPELCEFLSCRFPYIFIDEFQDTNPVQTQFVKRLGEAGSVIGVIGDPAQSIYAFQGARPEDFDTFSLPGQVDYRIENNWRSTDAIISLLNRLRKDDLTQEGLRRDVGSPVQVIVGDFAEALTQVQAAVSPGMELVTLARGNGEVSQIRNMGKEANEDTWDEFAARDSERHSFIDRLAPTVELARSGRFAVAVDDLTRALFRRRGELRRPIHCGESITRTMAQGLAVTILERILSVPNDQDEWTLKDAYNLICDTVLEVVPTATMSKITRGEVATLAETIHFGPLTRMAQITDDTRNIRTIHKAKGAEFDAVLVSISNLAALDRCFDHQASNREEERILYVACSRAKHQLFVHIPTHPSKKLVDILTQSGVEITTTDGVTLSFAGQQTNLFDF